MPTRAQFAHGLAENVAAQVLAMASGLQPHPRSRPPPAARTSRRASPPSSTSARSPTSPRSISADTFERPIYAGNAIATVQSLDADQGDHGAHHRLRSGRRDGGIAAVERSTPVADSGKCAFVGSEIAKNDRPELTAAKIIVSGGRAMGSSDKFNEC